MFAVFVVLEKHPDGIQARDTLAEVEATLGLTEYEQENYPGTDLRRFEKTVRFQTINAVKAGWMVKQKGTWTITDAGREAYTAYPEPVEFYDQSRALYKAWAKASKRAGGNERQAGADRAELEEVGGSVTAEKAEESAASQVWAYLAELDPYDFQELVAGLLQGMGYHVDWVAPPGKDRGVDIVAFKDPLGAQRPRIKVQVKREQGKTDAKGLRAFTAVLGPSDVGVFVSLGGFTSDAESDARNAENRVITLIDRTRLLDLWTEHYERVPDERRSLLPLKPVHYLAREIEE